MAQTKGQKLNGFAIVEHVGSSDCGGPNEISYAKIRMTGSTEQYRWFGGVKIDCLELQSGQQIHLRAFVREGRNTLYRGLATV
jgi:hypothetical protein